MNDDRTAADLIGRRTQQRATVLTALIHSDDFASAQSLHARLVAAGKRVGLSTVYRTLTALAEAGRADVVRDLSGERLFRYRPSEQHQHYLLCRTCGLGQPVDATLIESWAAQITDASGYADVQHTVELTGTCPDCTRVRHTTHTDNTT